GACDRAIVAERLPVADQRALAGFPADRDTHLDDAGKHEITGGVLEEHLAALYLLLERIERLRDRGIQLRRRGRGGAGRDEQRRQQYPEAREPFPYFHEPVPSFP